MRYHDISSAQNINIQTLHIVIIILPSPTQEFKMDIITGRIKTTSSLNYIFKVYKSLQQDYNFTTIFHFFLSKDTRARTGRHWWCIKQISGLLGLLSDESQQRESRRSLCPLALLSSAYHSHPTINVYDLFHNAGTLTKPSRLLLVTISDTSVPQTCHVWWEITQGGPQNTVPTPVSFRNWF